MAHDLGAAELRSLGVRLRDPPGIHVALDRIKQCPDKMLLVHEGEESRRLLDRDQLELHPQVAATRLGHLQPVKARAGSRQHDAAGQVHAAGLAGEALELLVQVDRVLLQLGDIRIAVDGVHAAGGVPGGAAGELPTLEQQYILPAGLGEVIQDADAHHAAPDHHHPCVALHRASVIRSTPRAAPAAAPCRCAHQSARSARSERAQSPCPPVPPHALSGNSHSRHRGWPRRASPGARR